MKISLKSSLGFLLIVTFIQANDDNKITPYNGSEVGYLFDKSFGIESFSHKIDWKQWNTLKVIEKKSQQIVYQIDGQDSLLDECYQPLETSVFSSDGRGLAIYHKGPIEKKLIKQGVGCSELVGLHLTSGVCKEKFKIKDFYYYKSNPPLAVSNDCTLLFMYDKKKKKIVCFKDGQQFDKILTTVNVKRMGYQEYADRLVLIDQQGEISFINNINKKRKNVTKEECSII